MSGCGLTAPGMTEPSCGCDATITIDRDGGCLPNPAEFAVAAERAASARLAWHRDRAHGQGRSLQMVAVQAADQLAAVAVALAVVSEALSGPVASATR